MRQINFLEVLFGLIVQPGLLTEQLMEEKPAPFGLTLFLCFVLTIFVPIITQIVSLGLLAYEGKLMLSLACVFFFTFLIFVFIEGVLLLFLGLDLDVGTLITAICYTLTPFMIGIWVMYGVNFVHEGSLTIVTSLITGSTKVEPRIMKLIPFALIIVNFSAFMIYYHALRYSGELHSLTALTLTVISAAPLYLSLAAAVAIGEYAVPGTVDSILAVFPWARPLTNNILFGR